MILFMASKKKAFEFLFDLDPLIINLATSNIFGISFASKTTMWHINNYANLFNRILTFSDYLYLSLGSWFLLPLKDSS